MTRSFLLVLLAGGLMLSGCNMKGGHEQSATTVVDRSSSGTGADVHIRLVMSDYVMRAALGENPNTAAYVTIRNEGDQPDRLMSASCACASMVMLHNAAMQEQTQGAAVAPGESLSFAPGGNHIMLMGLKTRPKAGDTETVVLHFEKAGDVTLSVPVSDTPQDHKH